MGTALMNSRHLCLHRQGLQKIKPAKTPAQMGEELIPYLELRSRAGGCCEMETTGKLPTLQCVTRT